MGDAKLKNILILPLEFLMDIGIMMLYANM